MILQADEIAKRLTLTGGDDAALLSIIPTPDLDALRASGAASVDLRLGTWFVSPRATKTAILDIGDSETGGRSEEQLMKTRYVPFGGYFVLHPRSFVLGVTLEWIKLPRDLTGYVVGKSSWGRRGLIIETAMGVHPSFSGCLTLELANVGELPIAVRPGMLICQLFLHGTTTATSNAERSKYVGFGRPVLGPLKLDEVAARLVPQSSP